MRGGEMLSTQELRSVIFSYRYAQAARSPSAPAVVGVPCMGGQLPRTYVLAHGTPTAQGRHNNEDG